VPSPSWSDQPPYSPSNEGGQDGSWFSGSGGSQGGQDASWYPPKPPYTPNGSGEQDGSWHTEGQGGSGGANPPNPPTPTSAIHPLYGAALGSSQFGRPVVTVS